MNTVGDFFDFQNGYAFKSKDFLNQGKYKIIRIKELKDGLVKFFSDTVYIDDADCNIYKYMVEKGDVLFALTGDPVSKSNPLSWVGRVSYYEHDEPALLNQRVCKAIAKADISKEFLYYFFRQEKEFYSLASKATGSASQANISTKTLEQHNFQFFDRDTCNKIVGVLLSLDEKIELNNKINKNLEQQARAMFKSRFINFEPFGGNMPNAWHISTVSEIIEFHDSKRIPLSSRERANLDKIYPYYGATSIMDYVDRYLFDGIYLLLGEDGTVVDDKGLPILQYVEGKFWVNNHAHILTGKNGFNVELLYLLFSLTSVKAIVTGAVQPKISQTNLNRIPVVIPSNDELQQFDGYIQPIFAEIRSLRAENARLAEIRDNLLPKLMSGEIDVSNLDF